MTFLRAVALTVIAGALSASAHGAGMVDPEALQGLWKAKGRFGPDARGTLIIQKEGAAWSADMLGRRVPVRLEAGELGFELPEHLGKFRGKPEGKNILGHWFRFGTSVNDNGFNAPVSVSPVLLVPYGPSRWRGEIVPVQDDFTFFLFLGEKRPDGSLRAVLRNPEFDFGTQQGIERLVLDGNRVKLIGKRGDTEREVGVGSYDAENQVITLVFPSRGGSFDFRRDGDDSDFRKVDRAIFGTVTYEWYRAPEQLPSCAGAIV